MCLRLLLFFFSCSKTRSTQTLWGCSTSVRSWKPVQTLSGCRGKEAKKKKKNPGTDISLATGWSQSQRRTTAPGTNLLCSLLLLLLFLCFKKKKKKFCGMKSTEQMNQICYIESSSALNLWMFCLRDRLLPSNFTAPNVSTLFRGSQQLPPMEKQQFSQPQTRRLLTTLKQKIHASIHSLYEHIKFALLQVALFNCNVASVRWWTAD